MKKTHWPARLAAGCLVTLTLVGVAFAAGQQGSQSDPLVTLSYLTQKATPSILSQVDSKLTARETELKKQLSAVVEGYVKEVEDKLASSGGGSSVQPSGGASYQVVNLSAGKPSPAARRVNSSCAAARLPAFRTPPPAWWT